MRLDRVSESTVDAFLAEWHRIVAERDLDGLRGALAEDVRLGPPPYWDEMVGRDLVAHLLGLVVNTIEDFSYHREWRDGRELALEFRGHIGDLELQGIDLITLDDDGRISKLDVPMRPANAVVALRESIAPRMIAYLSGRREG